MIVTFFVIHECIHSIFHDINIIFNTFGCFCIFRMFSLKYPFYTKLLVPEIYRKIKVYQEDVLSLQQQVHLNKGKCSTLT